MPPSEQLPLHAKLREELYQSIIADLNCLRLQLGAAASDVYFQGPQTRVFSSNTLSQFRYVNTVIENFRLFSQPVDPTAYEAFVAVCSREDSLIAKVLKACPLENGGTVTMQLNKLFFKCLEMGLPAATRIDFLVKFTTDFAGFYVHVDDNNVDALKAALANSDSPMNPANAFDLLLLRYSHVRSFGAVLPFFRDAFTPGLPCFDNKIGTLVEYAVPCAVIGPEQTLTIQNILFPKQTLAPLPPKDNANRADF